MAYHLSIDSMARSAFQDDSDSRLTNQFRRSISIFSRKGTSSPESTAPSIPQAPLPAARTSNEKQKGWLEKTRSVCAPPKSRSGSVSSPKESSSSSSKDETPESASDTKSKLSKRAISWSAGDLAEMSRTSSRRSPKKISLRSPKGTILNAVPPARTIQMSPLEEEMATSPNDEILCAISEHPPTLKALSFHSELSLPSLQDIESCGTTSLSQQARSRKRKDMDNRVGVWVDGIVHWDEDVMDSHKQVVEVEEEIGFTPFRPAEKPHLSVIIPGDASEKIPAIWQPQPRRLAALANPSSKFSRPQGMVPEKARKTLGLAMDVGCPVSPPSRPNKPSSNAGENFLESRSTSSNSSARNESSTGHSRRSSATSMERSSTPSSLDSKPLPPIPAAEAEPEKHSDAVELPSKPKPHRAGILLRASPNPDGLSYKLFRPTRSVNELDDCDRNFLRASPYNQGVPSPTLSQAEQDLRYQLAALSPKCKRRSGSKDQTDSSGIIRRKSSVREIMQPPVCAPVIPKRSRKREWCAPKQTSNSEYIPAPHLPARRRSDAELKAAAPLSDITPVRKAASIHRCGGSTDSSPTKSSSKPGLPHIAQLQQSEALRSPVPSITANAHPGEVPERADEVHPENMSEHATDEISDQPETILEADESTETELAVPTRSAENVLLQILSSLTTPEDLFNTAIINKGMYRVYKENEMYLLRTIASNQSPPAYEFREWSPPAGRNDASSTKPPSQQEHTPTSYMRSYRRGVVVIARLKKLILEHCQTFIRKETAAGLADPSHASAQRFDDAFWRIWCFCKIFGCNKGREDDITGQLDWLKGGLLANNQGTSATVNTNLDFDMSSVLLNAPDFFAAANEGGLSAAQLFDMTELWTCMTVLLQGYHERADQARQYGVFAKCNIEEGDAEREGEALEEWTAYLLTLGPHVVLAMAQHMGPEDEEGFAMAKKFGWTQWTPPLYSSSRTNFLKEPVAKSYEAQVASATLRYQDPHELQMKERSRQRVATLAAEIRLRRQSSEYKRLPLIGMDCERAMSIVSRRDSAYSSRSARSSSSRSTSSRYSTATPMTAPSLWGSPGKFSTIVEARWEGHPTMRHFGAGVADTSGQAVKRIVSMGFTPGEAKEALRVTDLGDGLRLDRAVEWLLRQC
ncbi:hypothetical protein MYCFIDRAFT_213610 [Lecanosticta acicola]|uniref:UBA domain-containing protein n=1 Tax=Lecanosticta acicola TaxID=111012 RepID=A0AAI8YUK0_9PEZI|nr:hypothetical protein MYCFIDRAFT_213610 [Lecanosticta acicola]